MFCNKKGKLPEQYTLHLALLQLKNNLKALLLQQGTETKRFECKAFMWQGKESVKSRKITLENNVLILRNSIYRPINYWKMYYTGKKL